jgi:hypothetical protein
MKVEKQRAHDGCAVRRCGLELFHDVRPKLFAQPHHLDDRRLRLVTEHPDLF